MGDTCVFREIAIRQAHVWEECFRLIVDVPSNNTHLCSISKSSVFPLYFVLLVRSMKKIVACLAQGDEVIWPITACLSRLNMMHIQDKVFRLAFTLLTTMVITKKGRTRGYSRNIVVIPLDTLFPVYQDFVSSEYRIVLPQLLFC